MRCVILIILVCTPAVCKSMASAFGVDDVARDTNSCLRCWPTTRRCGFMTTTHRAMVMMVCLALPCPALPRPAPPRPAPPRPAPPRPWLGGQDHERVEQVEGRFHPRVGPAARPVRQLSRPGGLRAGVGDVAWEPPRRDAEISRREGLGGTFPASDVWNRLPAETIPEEVSLGWRGFFGCFAVPRQLGATAAKVPPQARGIPTSCRGACALRGEAEDEGRRAAASLMGVAQDNAAAAPRGGTKRAARRGSGDDESAGGSGGAVRCRPGRLRSKTKVKW